MNKLTILLFLQMMFMTVGCSTQERVLGGIDWKIAGTLPPAKGEEASLGVAGPVAGVHNGALLVAGGANFPDAMPWLGGKKQYYDAGYVFKMDKEGNAAYGSSFRLPFPLAYSASCSTPLGIISAGGENAEGLSNNVVLLQWNEASKAVQIQNLPNLPEPVTNAAITAIGTRVFVGGGELKTNVSDQFYVLDVKDTSAGWQRLPSIPKAVSHGVMAALSNDTGQYVYVIGGRKRNPGSTSDLYPSVYRFDLATGKWTEKRPLPYAMSAGTGIAANGNTILLFGGDTGETFHKAESLIAGITSETDSIKKQALDRQKIEVQSTHPGFHKRVLVYNTDSDEWATTGSIPFDVPVTTTAILLDNHVVIPSGEIRAGVRTPHILLGKIAWADK